MTSTFRFIRVNANLGKSSADSQDNIDNAKSFKSSDAMSRPYSLSGRYIRKTLDDQFGRASVNLQQSVPNSQDDGCINPVP